MRSTAIITRDEAEKEFNKKIGHSYSMLKDILHEKRNACTVIQCYLKSTILIMFYSIICL